MDSLAAVWRRPLLALILFAAPLVAGAQEQAPTAARVQAFLEKRCLGCHGVGAKLGGLDLHTRTGALKGGVKGPALVPGSPERSLLLQMMRGQRAPKMPPNATLSAAEIELVAGWVRAGAEWPGQALTTAQAQSWWSFEPVRVTPPPPDPSPWVANPIDAFVLRKLRASGLSPSPPASRRELIRRAYFDLIGLPPTPEEVEAFVRDGRPAAWERVVDALLASPRYGERWGRHWLDLVRFAESSGYEGDKDRPLAWRYRDYVINAFNADKPYDRFLTEQLAGDEVSPGDPESLIATGFLACGLEDFAMAKLPTTRADELDDLVSTTGNVMLGLTINCARCHDHKYDPVSQVDYYRIQGIFAPTERREVEVPTPAEKQAWQQATEQWQTEATPLQAEFGPLRARGLAAAKAAGMATPDEEQIAAALPEPERVRYRELAGRVAALEARRPQLPRALTVTDKKREWGPNYLLLRGDAYHPGPEVAPGFITRLPGGDRTVPAAAVTAATTGRRLALARWICSDENPLTARVWVNRVWRQHFGRGIVASPSNFGLNGDQPSHPELLDWLAVTFRRGGWRLKPIHRLIMLSSTYRQSGRARPEALRTDPLNRLVWRVPVRRLEAEAIRDSILAVSGSLNLEMGGPPVYPPVDSSLRADTFQGVNWPDSEDSPKTWRRSVYVKVKRSLLLPQLEVFDCPEITSSVPQRNATTTPLQALMLLNDPLIRRQAREFAARLRREAGAEAAAQVRRAYALALNRSPIADELRTGVGFLSLPPGRGGDRLVDFCQALFNLNEYLYSP